MNEPYVRGRGTEYEAIQYANKLIKTDDAERDLDTLNCYHDIKCGQHQGKMMSMPLDKIANINDWMHSVELAFQLGDYNV
jgi:hypothetical protein